MNILSKKAKEEIKNLIHTIEYCKTYLAALEPMSKRLVEDKNIYDPNKWEELNLNTTMEIAKTRVLLADTRKRLGELGVY